MFNRADASGFRRKCFCADTEMLKYAANGTLFGGFIENKIIRIRKQTIDDKAKLWIQINNNLRVRMIRLFSLY